MRAQSGLLCLVAACDPIWGVSVAVQHPGRMPIEDATVAVACVEGHYSGGHGMAVRTSADGTAHLGGLGSNFPIGCDVFVAKPGYITQRIRYRDLCPAGPSECNRGFSFDLVLAPVR
jgi:hypothetical protein